MQLKQAAILLFFLNLMQYSLQAQTFKKITLDAAIELSLQNSKKLKTSQAKIDEATAGLQQAIEQKLPNASVTGSYLRLNSANIDLKTKSNNNGGNSGGSPNVTQAVYGLLNISLPIYTGGRIKFGIESSYLLKKAVMLDAENDKEEVVQTSIESFANLFKAYSAVRLVKENLARSRQLEKELTDLEKNGLLARNDLLKAQLQSSNIELNLLDADNNLQLANLTMNLMLGLPDSTRIFPDTSGIEKNPDNRVLDDYLQSAFANRKDMAALDYKTQAAASGVKSIKGEMYPSLQLTGGYIAADIPNLLTVTNAVNLGLGVSYNIGSLWKTKSKVKGAEARVKQWSLDKESKEDAIRYEVSKNYLTLLSDRKKIDVNQKSVEQSAENYRITKNKFDNGLATLSDLLEADVAQLQASLAYTLARADAFVAYHQLLLSAGVLTAEMKK